MNANNMPDTFLLTAVKTARLIKDPTSGISVVVVAAIVVVPAVGGGVVNTGVTSLLECIQLRWCVTRVKIPGRPRSAHVLAKEIIPIWVHRPCICTSKGPPVSP